MVLHQCIRPLVGALLRAIMDISARISHRHQDTSPEGPPVVELGHLFLIVLMTQDLKISGHPLMRAAEFTPSPPWKVS
jgi:hypothetical protein